MVKKSIPLLEANIQKIAFEGVIRLNGTSNIVTVPKTTQYFGFVDGVKVRVIMEKIEDDLNGVD